MIPSRAFYVVDYACLNIQFIPLPGMWSFSCIFLAPSCKMLIARKWSTFLCKNVNAVLVSFVFCLISSLQVNLMIFFCRVLKRRRNQLWFLVVGRSIKWVKYISWSIELHSIFTIAFTDCGSFFCACCRCNLYPFS